MGDVVGKIVNAIDYWNFSLIALNCYILTIHQKNAAELATKFPGNIRTLK